MNIEMGIGWFNVTRNNILLTTVVHLRHYDPQAHPLPLNQLSRLPLAILALGQGSLNTVHELL